MQRILELVATCAIAVPLTAQNTVAPTLTAQSNLVAFAGATSTTVPTGTAINNGVLLQTSVAGWPVAGVISSVNVHSKPRSSLFLGLGDNVNVERPSTSAGTGPNDMLLVLTSQQPVAVEIAMSYHALSTLMPQFASATGAVDIGADGSFELSGSLGTPANHTQVVVVTPLGLPIRILTQTGVSLPAINGRSQVIASLQLNAKPASPCTLTGSGGGHCTALSPYQSGALSYDHTLLLETQWQAQQPVLTVVGFNLITQPIPGTICLLNVQPVVAIAGMTNNVGLAQLELPIPIGLPLTGHAQAIVLEPTGSLSFLTTTVTTIICP